jgi:D-3-phosphoglycerate dehydrogenase / 2-oxoglutarate reductase
MTERRARVLHLEPERFGPDERAPIEAVADVDYEAITDQAAFREALRGGDYDAVFVRVGIAVGASEIAAAPRLRWVVTPTTGLDHLDLDALAAAGAEVIALKGAIHLLRTVHATAEHTWGLLLALVRHTVASRDDVLQGGWRRERYLGTELHGRTLGVLGYGRLGRMVAAYGLAFGMTVLAHDIDAAAFDSAPEGVEAVGLEELLEGCDVLTVHLPLDDTTRGFLSADRLGRLRPGVWLVNTARGELVDEAALLDALREGRLAGAALDVVADDSVWPGRVPAGQGLVEYARGADNLLITPHIGGYARDSVASTRRFVADRFAEALQAAPSAS